MPNNEINMDVQGQGSASVSMNPSVDDAAFVGRAEAWAVGKRNGTDVPSTDPAYHNNAKYYATEAAASAEDAHQYTAAAVHTWLENNVDPETGYVLDRTLSEKLAAAPADMVGDLKSALQDVETLKYRAVVTGLGESNRKILYANPGDTIEIKTVDGSNFTVGYVYFRRLDGSGPYWGIDSNYSSRQVQIGTSNQNPIYYVYFTGGTAQDLIVTNLTSHYNFEDEIATLQEKTAKQQDAITDVNVDITDQLIIGKAFSNGTFNPGRTDTRYVYRSCKSLTKISVTSGYWSTPKIVFYASDGSVVEAVDGTTGMNTTTKNIPSGAVMYAANSTSESQYLNQFAIVETCKLVEKVYENENDIRGLQREYAHLVTPTWIPAVVGHPLSIYFENMIADGFLKDYFVDEFRTDCYQIIPTSAGTSNITIPLYDKRYQVDKKTISVRAIGTDQSGTGVVLIIGDSKTASQTPWVTLHDLLDADSNVNFTFVGTVTSGYINREGYSGQDVINFCDSPTLNGATNIFYNANITTQHGHHFDFAQAVQTLGNTPDIVFIDHGANQWSDNWDTIKGCYDDMIDSIHAVSNSIKIVIVIQEGTGLADRINHTTDGKWWLQNPSFTNAQKMLSEYIDRENELIYIQPQYLCMDLYKDFPLCSLPAFEGASGEVEYCVDGTHPGINTNTWSSSTSYKYGAWITKGGKGYAAKKANSNIDPENDDGTYWSLCKNAGDGYIPKGQMYYYMLKYLSSI